MTIRDKFIEDVVDIVKERRDITLYSKFRGFDASPELPLRIPDPMFVRGYTQGIEDAIGVLMSITDSRELNGAPYRITDTKGEVITFYPKDSEECAGLIAAIWEKVSS